MDAEYIKTVQHYKDQFELDKSKPEYEEAYLKDEPLVTVFIATYNKGETLVNFSLKSVLEQTYQNLDIVVVGDCCTDNTEELVSKIKDPRLTFVNLSEPGIYPEDPTHRWMVAGYYPATKARELGRGDFAAQLDDDDMFYPTKIEKLVKHFKETRADVIYHPFHVGHVVGAEIRVEHVCDFHMFAGGYVTTGSVAYHGWFLKNIPGSLDAYKENTPGDWHRFKKMVAVGANIQKYPETFLFKTHSETQPISPNYKKKEINP